MKLSVTSAIILGFLVVRYIMTTKANLFNAEMNLNGFMVTGVLGYRF